jgi:molybdenum cofactor biosynthesis enzyme MoaA
MSFDPQTNFYCSQKFTWLSIDVEKRLSYSCCAAKPEKIDMAWLKNNPGKLFNTPELHQDRVDMLSNRPVSSCNEACWKPESQQLVSRRISMKTYEPVDLDVNVSAPDTLNIILGSTCNLTCSYCCKQYSSAWARDIKDNGSYVEYKDRYRLTPMDHVVFKISQNEHQDSSGFKTLLKEIYNFKTIKEIQITGGEPFLYNWFPELLNNLAQNQTVSFFTGLGLDHKRLQKQIEKIDHKNKIKIYVSAENCGALYQFNRYGNTYENFKNNLQLCVDAGFEINFSSVISNLTVFGLVEFAETFKKFPIIYHFCNDPDFLSVHVLDPISKQQLEHQLQHSRLPIANQIIDNLQKFCPDWQKNNYGKYIKEFAKRRNLSLDIFPPSMLQWLGV